MVKKIVGVISLFVLAYTPELFGVNLMNVLTLFSLVYLFINYKQVIEFVLNRRILIVNYSLTLLIMYLVIIASINGAPLGNIGAVAYLVIRVLPISLFIILISRTEPHLTVNTIINNLVIASCIQGIIAIISFFVPAIQSFFLDQLVLSGYSDVYVRAGYRMYGFSTTLTFATPALQAMVVILILITRKISIKNLVSVLIISFSAVVNSRTSLVILSLGIMLTILYKNNNKIIQFFTGFTILVILIGILTGTDLNLNIQTDNSTFKWIISGYNQIIGFLSGSTDTGYFSYITNENVYNLPTDINLLFGTGYRVMQATLLPVRSDIGFINDIWLGGVLYTLSIYSIYLYILLMIRQLLFKINFKNYNLMFVFLVLTLLALNVKGYIFTFNSVSNIIFLMFYSLLYTVSNNREVRKGGLSVSK